MLRTNLATRPFYNERLVFWVLGLGFVLVTLFTIFNLTSFFELSGRQRALADAASRDEQRARELSARAAEVRRRIDPKVLERVTTQATEASAIIDARAFSWTALFNDIERTLPADVMLTSVAPKVAREGALIQFVVVGRSVEAVDTFIERLEETGRFSSVFASAEEVTDEGHYRTTLTATYLPPKPAAADAAGEVATAAPRDVPQVAAQPVEGGGR